MATLRAIRNNEPTTNASAARVDMKLEVVVIPVSDVDRAKDSGGDSTPISPPATTGVGSSSRRPAPGAL